MTDCFLIADEVGLGKTKSAKTVLFEMTRLKENHDVHAIYIASSTELADQNMNDEFCNYKNKIGNQKHNYAELAEFQKATARKVMKSFFGEYNENDGDKYQGNQNKFTNISRLINTSA